MKVKDLINKYNINDIVYKKVDKAIKDANKNIFNDFDTEKYYHRHILVINVTDKKNKNGKPYKHIQGIGINNGRLYGFPYYKAYADKTNIGYDIKEGDILRIFREKDMPDKNWRIGMKFNI